ncbi:dicarboxylate/amino acid:cation symporter [Chelatococcus reniformis]|uniref:C4-dicarboxylate transport protein n=1 Tax=Chelatococcus reniformis TaxID=1494448 RepID=A0A916UPX0_9HYPH|nr:dicarboxylate/amino acid:cation symporter [Chelatococcus reniformis]GGC80935.1 C4-dicarboxylate transport protein 4 [Chelatococcus reniformis]
MASNDRVVSGAAPQARAGVEPQRTAQPWYKVLYIQVLIAIALGVLVGHLFPHTGEALKPLGDGFIALIKMMIAPVIFCTVVHGIASVSDLRKVGRVGIKALVYFETVSTIALVIGLLVGRTVQPGAGFNIDASSIDAGAVQGFVRQAASDSFVGHLMAIIPSSFLDALVKGDLLQVLLIAILTGVAAANMGEAGRKVEHVVDVAGKLFFRIIGMIVKLAPIGAFGAMAFTIGKYGLGSLVNLGQLIATFYLTSALFVLVVLGTIARLAGFSILRFLAYIKDELLIVLGTSSSETVLPHIMRKMERLGASKSVVGLVVPTGYSFNLDGTNIYMTLATLFLAQATNTPLTIWQELSILGIAMLTSKGASGVTGAGFITLAATLSIIPDIPIAALAVLIGIDKFMSECRALTNLIGNGVATIVISRWEGELDKAALQEAMAHPFELSDRVEAEIARKGAEVAIDDPPAATPRPAN